MLHNLKEIPLTNVSLKCIKLNPIFTAVNYCFKLNTTFKSITVNTINIEQRCQLLRITRSHYEKLQKFSVFYGLRKTQIFLRDFFFKSSNQKCCQKITK